MTHKSFRFESFTLDLERLCLHGPSGQAELRRKSFEVLRYLVEHAGRVVTKQDLFDAVWPGGTVTDQSLRQCINEVRRALDDKERRVIKTVPQRGYLIDMPVSVGVGARSYRIPAVELPKAEPAGEADSLREAGTPLAPGRPKKP
jgi:DNA-binding winged helix-turn-helix (wHTH) protein